MVRRMTVTGLRIIDIQDMNPASKKPGKFQRVHQGSKKLRIQIYCVQNISKIAYAHLPTVVSYILSAENVKPFWTLRTTPFLATCDLAPPRVTDALDLSGYAKVL